MRRFDVLAALVAADESEDALDEARITRIQALPDAELLGFYHDLNNNRAVGNVPALPLLRAEITARGLSIRKN